MDQRAGYNGEVDKGSNGDDIEDEQGDEADKLSGEDSGLVDHPNDRIEDGSGVYMGDVDREDILEPVLKSPGRFTEKRSAPESIDKHERPRKKRKQAQEAAAESDAEEDVQEQGRRWIKLEDDIFVSL